MDGPSDGESSSSVSCFLFFDAATLVTGFKVVWVPFFAGALDAAAFLVVVGLALGLGCAFGFAF